MMDTLTELLRQVDHRQCMASADDAEQGEWLDRLACSPVRDLLVDAGFTIEGPGGADCEELRGRYWWTLYRPGWSSVECGEMAFKRESWAVGDAVRALLIDEDIDWEHRQVRAVAAHSFPEDFDQKLHHLR